MHFSATQLVAASLLLEVSAESFTTSDKRGLVFIPNTTTLVDDAIWVKSGTDLTWYYNYQVQPSSAYAEKSQAEFEFVPQLWGLSDTSFLTEVKALVSGGRNISHVLTFNEPDGKAEWGGSNITPADAAAAWIKEIEPLRTMGIKAGAPVTMGWDGGFTWLSSFFASCESQGHNCTADFIPIHYYGNLQGLYDHVGRFMGTYPDIPLWITEYAADNQALDVSQDFFKQSANWFDRLSIVERYSYFGSFRSDVSNVGPNAAMLTESGNLTDIGSWYLGGAATNNIPSSKSSTKSGAVQTSISVFLVAVTGATALSLLA